MTTMVMLSHPTPPVSELDARQLSIMFSQIACSSCFAAMPLRTNSTTACEDWQSQMPGWSNVSSRLKVLPNQTYHHKQQQETRHHHSAHAPSLQGMQ